MAIGTPVDLGHNQNVSATTLAITTLAAVNAGDFICIFHYSNSTLATTASITDTAGNTYFQAVRLGTGTPPIAEIYYAYNALAEASSSTITVNFSSSAQRHGVSAFSVSGMATAYSPFNVVSNSFQGTATGSTLLTIPALSQPDELQVAGIFTASAPGAVTWGGSYVAVGGNTATAFALPAWQIVNSTASTTVQPTWINSINARTVAASFRGAAGSLTGLGGGFMLTGVGS